MRHNRSKSAKREQRGVVAAPAAPERVSRDHRATAFGFSLLMGLQRKPVWTGVEGRGTVEARRVANRLARRARRASR